MVIESPTYQRSSHCTSSSHRKAKCCKDWQSCGSHCNLAWSAWHTCNRSSCLIRPSIGAALVHGHPPGHRSCVHGWHPLCASLCYSQECFLGPAMHSVKHEEPNGASATYTRHAYGNPKQTVKAGSQTPFCNSAKHCKVQQETVMLIKVWSCH